MCIRDRNLQETQLSFSRKFRRQVPLLGPSNELDYGEVTLDQTLIGGLIVKVGAKMIYSSIRSKLENLQNIMKEVR